MKIIKTISISIMVFAGMTAGISFWKEEAIYFKVGLVIFAIGYAVGKIKVNKKTA
jgi:hypothetical protein